MEVHELSASASACIHAINHYGFNGEMDIADMGIPGFLSETRDLPYNERLAYVEALINLGIKLPQVAEITQKCEAYLKASGNAYIYIREQNVMGEPKIYIEAIHPLNLAYIKPDPTDNSGVRTFAFSENFDQMAAYQFKYKLIRAYPEWSENEGVKETIIHIKSGYGKSTWYGRPKSLSVLYEMIAEWKQGEQRMKVANADFVSTMILAFEQDSFETDTQGDENKQSEAIRTGKVLRAAMTNAGDNPSALMTIDYPHGGKAPTPIEVKVNRDHQYMQGSNDVSTAKIYSCFDWSRELTGNSSVRGGIGANILKDLFSIKYTTTIQPLQEFWAAKWGEIFSWYLPQRYTVKFPNLIENYNWNANEEAIDNNDSETINDSQDETID